MKKQAVDQKPSEAKPASHRVRRPMRDLLYGPGAVRLRASEPIESDPQPLDDKPAVEMESVEIDQTVLPEAPRVEAETVAAQAAPARAPEQPIIEEAREDSDSRARRIVSSMLENEKKNLPDWVGELLAPLDEPRQLAFLIKHKAEIKAASKGKAPIPPSPAVAKAPQNERRAVMGHRRLYDSF